MSMQTEATTIKNRAGALLHEASSLIAQSNAKYKGSGHPLPDAKEAIHCAMEADHYAGMVLLHYTPHDKDLAVRCFKNAKAYIGNAEKALTSAKTALAGM